MIEDDFRGYPDDRARWIDTIRFRIKFWRNAAIIGWGLIGGFLLREFLK